MDRGAWRATVHGATRVAHNLATKPPTLVSKKGKTATFLHFFLSAFKPFSKHVCYMAASAECYSTG